jgi:8-oxo-dGTP diphosphatase
MMYKLRIKSWLLKDGKFILSEGRAKLLEHIEREKSLLKASEIMGMSYRHAWGTIKEIEETLGKKVVRSLRGGKEGGYTMLTKTGKDILYEYTRRTEDAVRYAEEGAIKVAVDGIIIHKGKLVLIQRAYEPYKGKFALPGGFVEYGEKTEEAVVREAREETGLRTSVKRLLGVYSAPDRDPRGQVVSSVYKLKVLGGKLKTSHEVKKIELFPLNKIPKLAFDHSKIVKDFLAKSSYC